MDWKKVADHLKDHSHQLWHRSGDPKEDLDCETRADMIKMYALLKTLSDALYLGLASGDRDGDTV